MGCGDSLDKNFETLTGNYKIGYFNSSQSNENVLINCNNCKKMISGLINKKIKRAGFNERFLIIERVGNYDDWGVELDSLTISYYIIDMKKESNVYDKEFKEYYFGPVNYEAFQLRRKELGIEDLKFTKEYKVN